MRPSGERELIIVFGPFDLERRLAVGGSAEVYLARPRVGDRPAPRLVIKRLVPSLRSAEHFTLLSREAELHRAVEGDHVVKIYGAGMVEEEPYLAMEYVEGVDAFRLLRAAQAEGRALPVPLCVYIARCVAEALRTVHAAMDEHGSPLGLVHGDVSPSNIYLSLHGDVKLGDFGIARVLARASDSGAQAVKGKWEYVAPEVLDGLPCDHRADLFSLAAVLGEMVLGERIFPGGSQLAVLLSIREANIEPLREARSRLPAGLFEVLETALARDPLRRYQDAAAFAAALAPYEQGTAVPVETALSAYVARAADHAELAKRIESRVRDSVKRMQAVRPQPESEEETATTPPPRPSRALSLVRRASGQQLGAMTFASLVEMIATGELDGRDEVALMGAAEFRRIEDVEELSRHLLPSTTKQTGQLFEPGVPDYAVDLAETAMMRVLAYLRERHETGALFVEQRMPKLPPSRKELYLSAGRLVHVVSSDPEELFGRYLVRRGKLTPEQLEQALDTLDSYGGRLGDTLVGLGFVDVVDVFQAIRDQGRDRVGRLCAWSVGRAAFYRGAGPGAVQFPLDLDLSSAMMSGAILANDRRPERALPDGGARVVPGPRAAEARDRRERGTAPTSLQAIPGLAATQPTLRELLHLLTTGREAPNARVIGTREACAALVVAQALGWIEFRG